MVILFSTLTNQLSMSILTWNHKYFFSSMASSLLIATGYGPRNRLYFKGDPELFPIWETSFINYLYTVNKQVHDAITGENEGDDFNVHNRRAYAELVQVLDKRSLQLIMHDTRNDGKEAFKILKDHYASTEKPQISTLYQTLTTLIGRHYRLHDQGRTISNRISGSR